MEVLVKERLLWWFDHPDRYCPKTFSQPFLLDQGVIEDPDDRHVRNFLLQISDEDDSDFVEYCDPLPEPEAQAVAYLNSLKKRNPVQLNAKRYSRIISLLYSNLKFNVKSIPLIMSSIEGIATILFYS